MDHVQPQHQHDGSLSGLMMMKQYLQVTKPGIIFGNLISVIGDSCWPRRGAWMCPCSSLTMVGCHWWWPPVACSTTTSTGTSTASWSAPRTAPWCGGPSPRCPLWYATALGVAGIALLCFLRPTVGRLAGGAGLPGLCGVYSLYMKRHSVYGTLVGSSPGPRRRSSATAR